MPALSNAQYERYAQEIARGMSQADAYRAAYPKSVRYTAKTVYNKAWEMRRIPEVDARIKELQDEAAAAAVMDRQERMEALSEIARDHEMHPKQRIQAIDVLNKMDSIYVHKVEADVKPNLNDAVEKIREIMDGGETI